MSSLCDIFGHQKLKKKWLPDKTIGYCPKCKPKLKKSKSGIGCYDLAILEKDTCPKCDTKLEHPKSIMVEVCEACGYNCV